MEGRLSRNEREWPEVEQCLCRNRILLTAGLRAIDVGRQTTVFDKHREEGGGQATLSLFRNRVLSSLLGRQIEHLRHSPRDPASRASPKRDMGQEAATTLMIAHLPERSTLGELGRCELNFIKQDVRNPNRLCGESNDHAR